MHRQQHQPPIQVRKPRAMGALWVMRGQGWVDPARVADAAQIVERVDGTTLVIGEMDDIADALLSSGFRLDSLTRALTD